MVIPILGNKENFPWTDVNLFVKAIVVKMTCVAHTLNIAPESREHP